MENRFDLVYNNRRMLKGLSDSIQYSNCQNFLDDLDSREEKSD